MSRMFPAKSLGCRYKSRNRLSSGHTSSAPPHRVCRTLPRLTNAARGWSWRSTLCGASLWVLSTATALPDCTSKCLFVSKAFQRCNDRVITIPVARGLASPAIYDEFLGFFGHLGVEIVHQHSLGCFLNPSLCCPGIPARRPNGRIRLAHRRTSSRSTLSNVSSQSACCQKTRRSLHPYRQNAIFTPCRNARPEAGPHLLKRGRACVVAKIECPSRGQQLDRNNHPGKCDGLFQLECRCHSHTDKIFLISAGGNRACRCWTGENTQLGNKRCRSYLRHHQTGLKTGLGRKKSRETFVQAWIEQPLCPALRDARELAQRDREIVERQRQWSTVKISSRDDCVLKDKRIVRGAIQFNLEDAAERAPVCPRRRRGLAGYSAGSTRLVCDCPRHVFLELDFRPKDW